jgi:hypothetical protein
MATEIDVRSVSGTLGASTLSDDMSALLARNWWVIGLSAVLRALHDDLQPF